MATAKKAATSKATQAAKAETDRETLPASEPPITTVIKRMSRELGLHQAGLSDALRKATGGPIGRAAVGRWFRGETTPELPMQVALANLFGITLDQLHGEAMAPASKQTVDIVGPTMDTIDDLLAGSVADHLRADQIIVPLPRIRTSVATLRPDLLIENEDAPVLAVFILQGTQHAALNVVGLAHLWRETGLTAPLYIGWINHGMQMVDFDPLVEQGYIAGFEVVQGNEVDILTHKGVVFANLRAQVCEGLAPAKKRRGAR